MADETTPDDQDTRAELERVDSQIADLRQGIRDLRDGLVDAGPMDPEDRAAILTQADELQAVLGALEQRRESLVERT
jgi:hypothetical protein